MLKQCLEHAQATLAAAGVNAAYDPRDLVLPGVWLTPDSIEAFSLDGKRCQVTLSVACIVPNRGPALDVQALDELIADVEAIINPGTWRIESLTMPNHGSDPLPAATAKTLMEWSKQ